MADALTVRCGAHVPAWATDRTGRSVIGSSPSTASSAIEAELLSLVHAVQEAQTRLLLIVDPAVADLGERARFIIDELESALEFRRRRAAARRDKARKAAEAGQASGKPAEASGKPAAAPAPTTPAPTTP
ncbi:MULTISPECIES: hypothetical protein [Sorangium]|nr:MULTISPECIES: hypothetical protein [Sorangium]